jgi:NADH dehydrogenase FAD-containing subunit
VKNLLILGAGTAGTIMASHLRRKLSKPDWTTTLIDRAQDHYCQPGYLFMPFGIYSEDDVRRPVKRTVPRGIDYRESDVDRIDAGSKIYACKATVDMFHLTKDDLCPQVEKVLTVGEFYEISGGGQIIFT